MPKVPAVEMLKDLMEIKALKQSDVKTYRASKRDQRYSEWQKRY